MDALWSNTTLQDWIALGLIATVPLMMVVAIVSIHNELKRDARSAPVEPSRSSAPPLHLKTTKAQREQWRMGKQRHPRALADLADDVETLLKRVNAGG